MQPTRDETGAPAPQDNRSRAHEEGDEAGAPPDRSSGIYVRKSEWSQLAKLPRGRRGLLQALGTRDESRELGCDVERLQSIACVKAYRLRIGRFRCLFFEDDEGVWIVRIGPRDSVYEASQDVFRREVAAQKIVVAPGTVNGRPHGRSSSDDHGVVA